MTEQPVQELRNNADPSSSLLIRVRERNSDAWRRLVDLYSPLIFHWCRKCDLSPEDAADIVQEVFTAVAGEIDQFDHEREGATFRGWLWKITLNKVRDRVRRQPSERALSRVTAIAIEAADTDEPSETEDELILLRQAVDLILSEFEETPRRAFLRVVVDMQTPADVARELGISVNSVYLAKSRIRRRLKDEFQGLVESL